MVIKKLVIGYIVENTICRIKKEERISLRKDRKINTFMGWIYSHINFKYEK